MIYICSRIIHLYMIKKTLRTPQKELIEKFGVHLEREGMPPAAARILGLLLVSDEVELSFDDICQSLNFSKSTTSGAIQLLENTGRIDYITRPGDRKRYFRSKLANWFGEFESKFATLGKTKLLFQEALAQRTKETREFNRSLQLLVQFLEFMEEEMPLLIEKFKKKHLK